MKVWIASVYLAGVATHVAAASDTTTPVAEMERLTREMIADAVAHYQAVGHDQARQDFTNTEKGRWFTDQYNLHMFGMADTGIVWADAAWPAFIGTDFSDMTDFNGKPIGLMILENTPMDGGVYLIELDFMNAAQNEISVSIGACARPTPEHILCSWTNAD